jgi:hypothetical protein
LIFEAEIACNVGVSVGFAVGVLVCVGVVVIEAVGVDVHVLDGSAVYVCVAVAVMEVELPVIVISGTSVGVPNRAQAVKNNHMETGNRISFFIGPT